MALIALRCPSCSGDIQLDDSKEFGFCMHCGTKVMLQETVTRNVKIDNSQKLANLIKIAKGVIDSESATELRRLSIDILEIEADNWFGWFLKGVASSKSADCVNLYTAWKKAAELVPEDEYLEYRAEFVKYAARVSIKFGGGADLNKHIVDFLRIIDKKEPKDTDSFAALVVKRMAETHNHIIRKGTVAGVMHYAFVFAHSELLLHTDLRSFMRCYEEVTELTDAIQDAVFHFGESFILSNITCKEMLPYKVLYRELNSDVYESSAFECAAEYWSNHDISSYLHHFIDALETARKLCGAGTINGMVLNSKIRKSIKAMIDTYMNRFDF